MKNETKTVSTRVTLQLFVLIEEFCRSSAYLNIADFMRCAVKEKLQREAPGLYRQLFEEA